MRVQSIDDLIESCLTDSPMPGTYGPRDPWDEASNLASEEPDDAWRFITGFARRASSAHQFEKLAAGPLGYFWHSNHEQFLPKLRELSKELPQLVNLVIADDRRGARAAHVMNLIYELKGGRFRHGGKAEREFSYEPPPALAEMLTPGAHTLTETMWLPNGDTFEGHYESRKRVSDDELDQIVEGYIRAPSPPDDDDSDDWWWALNQLVRDSPEQAWEAILRIIAREGDGVDVGLLGAGALEDLVSGYGELLLPKIEAELETNDAFVRALSSAYLFSLSESVLDRLAFRCRQLLDAR